MTGNVSRSRESLLRRWRTAGLLRFAFYAAIGGVGTLIHYALLFLLLRLDLLTATSATTIGAIAGALVNYYLNARLNFRTGATAAGAARFFAVALCGIAVNALVVHLLSSVVSTGIVIAQAVATVAVLCLSFVLNSIWTFRRQPTPGPIGAEPAQQGRRPPPD